MRRWASRAWHPAVQTSSIKHADVFDFLELRKNHGKEEQRARDLFYGLWIPDLFMQRVKDNQDWTLFCPNEAYDEETGKGLMDVWGQEFVELYTRLEGAGKGRKTVKAQQLWFRILESQMETGTPYMLYKDHANRKSNQQNLGTIHCSNLCTEIIEYTSPDEVAVCNLASISLPAFASPESAYDFQRLYEVTKVVTRNLNKVIDRNYYPVPEARKSNMRHRPVGLGVQGLADAFLIMKLPFESEEAKRLNEDIFETIYFAACEASCSLAEACGPYETFAGSPASKGLLQYDLSGTGSLAADDGIGRASRCASPSLGCGTPCWWRPCPRPAQRRSWATTSPSSLTRRTSTCAESCRASSYR